VGIFHTWEYQLALMRRITLPRISLLLYFVTYVFSLSSSHSLRKLLYTSPATLPIPSPSSSPSLAQKPTNIYHILKKEGR
jgi:hypothetical protein